MSEVQGKQVNFEELRESLKVRLLSCLKYEDVDDMVRHVTDFPVESAVTEGDRKTAMDQVLRDVLIQLLDKEQECLERYITFCVECGRKQIVTPTMPVVLLGDVFDALTLDKCENMFTYVENGVSIWKEDLFFVACKNNLLRMCNDLLRRLSRSQNTIFCGRILLFLAKFFPFSERSGLNIVSEFNLENVTELGADDGVSLKDALSDGDPTGESSRNKLTIDYNLYCKFWSLQDYFRNPNMCYNKVHWKTFVLYSSSVLSAFSSYKLESVQVKNNKGTKRSFSQSMSVDDDSGKDVSTSTEEKHTNYFAKFLTNQKLLELELSDSNFRRCVLVQFLILFQYLNSSVKFKSESFELKMDQADWVKDTTDQVYGLLSETPPDGKTFAICVKHALVREEHWNNWKNEGCPEFQKMKSSTSSGQVEVSEESRRMLKAKRRRLLGDIIRDYEAQGKFYLGNNELTKLWNLCPNNLEACKTKERDFLPSLETYLAEAMNQCESGVTGADRVVSDGSWGWRALRLLARRSPHFFTHSNNPINRLPDYLDLMVRKVAKDIPSTQDVKQIKQESPDEEVSEEQMEADLMKGGDPNDVEQVQDGDNNEDSSGDGEKKSAALKPITDQQMKALCEKLQGDAWKKLGAKLAFKPDEIEHFFTTYQSDTERAKNMLKIWFDDDEDASIENLAYILDGLSLPEAAETLKEPEESVS